ncbi:NPHP3 [Symbiodinium sp. CCMP2456]|nr:NPHP3 [Symbiodinium sp. CCMP2456]
MNNLADVVLERYHKQEELIERSQNIEEHATGRGWTLHNLGTARGEFEDDQKLLKGSMTIREQRWRAGQPQLAVIFAHLEISDISRNSSSCWSRAIEDPETSLQTKGIEAVMMLSHMGAALNDLEDCDKKKHLLQRSLRSRRGEDH